MNPLFRRLVSLLAALVLGFQAMGAFAYVHGAGPADADCMMSAHAGHDHGKSDQVTPAEIAKCALGHACVQPAAQGEMLAAVAPASSVMPHPHLLAQPPSPDPARLLRPPRSLA